MLLPYHQYLCPGDNAPNKLRVATENTPGHFSSVGLYVDAGARYETLSNSGVSHFLDRMAFKVLPGLCQHGHGHCHERSRGQIMCSSSRETIMYQSSQFHRATPLALSLISETVQNASFLPEELDAQRAAAEYEIRELKAKPEVILPEILHHVAYDGKGLGNPLLCPEDRIDLIDASLMRDFMKQLYRPDRMVIAGAGIAHEELVELAYKHFSSLKHTPLVDEPASWLSSTRATPSVPPNLLHAQPQTMLKSLTRAASSYLYPNSSNPASLTSGSTYTGGYHFIHDPDSEFNHIYIAFEGVGIHDDDIYELATMQVLLGGGGSFSAGGPGKGMYSRLYTHILNHQAAVDHCASFHHIYNDSSLFGLFASFAPSARTAVLPHLIHQLALLLYRAVPADELSRAKNQLKSSLAMALESRAVEVEDLGRQLLVHNRKIPISEMADKIDAVTAESLQRVALRIFGSQSGGKPTVLAMGSHDLGDWQSQFRKYDVGTI
ncbi:mitochondrial processing peptidase [Multifurca ochricompacta]|uniref:Mitochondrial processing peptidase n=1 Tax=Multifurca ochricompacta TaxID=376703 RepID=A0AAD4LSW4_9AGAM|nr:mitochondrial processing peptidase [Multifurca ochricompacta]